MLPAGPLPHEPSVLLGSDMFGTVLDQIKQAGGRLHPDRLRAGAAGERPARRLPPRRRRASCSPLHGKTKIGNLRQTITRLRQVDADIIGVVLNGVPQARGRFDYYGYYGYRSEAASTNGSASTNGTKPGTPATNGKSAQADPAPAAPPLPGSTSRESSGDDT